MKTNELCCEDLMVRDWVMWKGKPVQVARVSGLMYSFGHIPITLAHCNDKGLLESHDIKSISPIPITPEILEKNEFEKCEDCAWSLFQHKEDGKPALYQIYWSTNGFYLEISSYTSLTGEFNRMGIQFVHQLQHALRLCGIDKTIEL